MDTFGALVGKVIDRLVEFFDVLDLSFFLTGVVCFAAVGFGVSVLGIPQPPWLKDSVFGAVLGAVACYVMGLLCYAGSRSLRELCRHRPLARCCRKLGWDPEPRPLPSLVKLIEMHGLEHHTLFREYLDRIRSRTIDPGFDVEAIQDRMYSRLWVELRQDSELKPSYALVRRYWVLGAVCNGMGMALLVWIIAGILWSCGGNPGQSSSAVPVAVRWVITLPVSFVVIVVALAAWREADRFRQHQSEELVATMAQRLRQDEMPPPETEPLVIVPEPPEPAEG